MAEIWKPVVGHEGFYEVSDEGRVRSVDREVRHPTGSVFIRRGREMKVSQMPGSGYPRVSLRDGEKAETFMVHVLVLEAFVGPRPDGHDACHADGTRTNNCLRNLRWDSRAANMADRQAHGRTQRGERHYRAKLTDEQVLSIRADKRKKKDIADDYGVTTHNVTAIKRRLSWAWLEAA